eukprot:PhF_6_TR27356/c0_g1_i1/m.40215
MGCTDSKEPSSKYVFQTNTQGKLNASEPALPPQRPRHRGLLSAQPSSPATVITDVVAPSWVWEQHEQCTEKHSTEPHRTSQDFGVHSTSKPNNISQLSKPQQHPTPTNQPTHNAGKPCVSTPVSLNAYGGTPPHSEVKRKVMSWLGTVVSDCTTDPSSIGNTSHTTTNPNTTTALSCDASTSDDDTTCCTSTQYGDQEETPAYDVNLYLTLPESLHDVAVPQRLRNYDDLDVLNLYLARNNSMCDASTITTGPKGIVISCSGRVSSTEFPGTEYRSRASGFETIYQKGTLAKKRYSLTRAYSSLPHCISDDQSCCHSVHKYETEYLY